MPRPQQFNGRFEVRIDKADIDDLDKIAKAKGETKSDLVRDLIQRYIKRHTAKPKTK